jgi:hypothetical protein
VSSPTTNPPSSEKPQARFTDRKGREWFLELDYAKARKIKTELRVDLGNLVDFANTWARLLGDDEKLIAVVWAAIGDAAGETTFDEFEASLDGEAVEAAKDALEAAVFFFTRPSKRGLIREGAVAVTRGYRKAIAEATANVKTATEEMLSRSLTTPGNTP